MTLGEISGEPRSITEPILLAIHAQQIERYGGAHGIVDQNVVLSALARPINLWAYEHESDFADLAAAYLVGFTSSQGFRDGDQAHRPRLCACFSGYQQPGHPCARS